MLCYRRLLQRVCFLETLLFMILPFSVRRDWKHQGLQAELAKAQGLPLPSTPLTATTSSRDHRQVQRELDASQRELQLVTIQAKDQAEQLEHDRSMQQNLLLGKHRASMERKSVQHLVYVGVEGVVVVAGVVGWAVEKMGTDNPSTMQRSIIFSPGTWFSSI